MLSIKAVTLFLQSQREWALRSWERLEHDQVLKSDIRSNISIDGPVSTPTAALWIMVSSVQLRDWPSDVSAQHAVQQIQPIGRWLLHETVNAIGLLIDSLLDQMPSRDVV